MKKTGIDGKLMKKKKKERRQQHLSGQGDERKAEIERR